ncbi:transporter family-2 protein [Algoriphagus faecimaris]|uniref:Transporter family-2 protein n=1 Tax=Algoriphagus faecimaris TaxID=686796 RepID=A0A1G6NAL7_9BACT|nr:DMT family transporter [Algoriphagus faecimaris]SDC64843.1 transporter family-2 protein [Algoriphagus faecimaris]
MIDLKMENLHLMVTAFGVGILIVLQGSLNAQLGVRLDNALVASSISLLVSASLGVLVVLLVQENMAVLEKIQTIPLYLLFLGGVLSFLAIASFYYVIPKIGISTTVAFGLSGQLIFAGLASHFGWFGLPVEPITFKRMMGISLMILSVLLIKS